jgi:peptidyl-prolyl cis-trans isomerase A (cyclophilin A)
MARFVAALLSVAAAAAACSSSNNTTPAPAPASTDEPDSGTPPAEEQPDPTPSDAGQDAADPIPGCPRDPGPPAQTVDPASKDDPTGGADKFTIAQALAGYPETPGVLTAVISTELGSIRCELDEAAAPISVANFVGLARGTRPFMKSGKWKLGRFYDGLIWHRVIPDFVIQGGDPLGKGTGGPGYDLVEENHVAEPLGTLAMAASNIPSGSQFYVVVGTGPSADYNVFGTCATEAAKAIAAVPRDKNDKPLTAVHMTRIDIARCPK